MPEGNVLAKGIAERIGLDEPFIRHKIPGREEIGIACEVKDHRGGITEILNLLTDPVKGALKGHDEIDAIGHRVVHGGEDFCGSVPITQDVIEALERNVMLAPLHNPPNLQGIYAMKELLPDVPQVGVFDTAFHQTMPRESYLYALPYRLYEQFRIRKYGFHGTSHRYVSHRACELLGLDPKHTRVITCHLGNGSSLTAVHNGRSVDTSMGLTPNEGLIMGTRCGDVDAGALLFIAEAENLDMQQMNTLINKQSGLAGISGVSSDMRELRKAAGQGNERAGLALDMFHYRIRKYIGAYAAVMGGLDVLVFTGGIGENDDLAREAICENMDFLGLVIDKNLNKGLRSREQVISTPDSSVKAIVVPTDEEKMIARDTFRIVSLQENEQ